MNRRDALLALFVLGAAPLRARAQLRKTPTIGLLTFGPYSGTFQDVLRAGLRDRGYVEGKTVLIESRSFEAEGDRANALAQELVRLKVDVIVASPTQAVEAAKGATSTIPIVMLAANPVESGFIASLGRPGGNVTGVATLVAELGPKLVELLKEFKPAMSRIAVLTRPQDKLGSLILAQIQSVASQRSVKIQPVFASGSSDLDAAFAAMVKERADAVIIQPTLATKRSAELALKHKLLSISTGIASAFPEDGGLISYGAKSTDMYRQVAVLVDKILKGGKPADMPVEQPTTFELAINLKTAKALGIAISPSMRMRADRVTE